MNKDNETRIVDADSDELLVSWGWEGGMDGVALIRIQAAHGEVVLDLAGIAALRAALDKAELAYHDPAKLAAIIAELMQAGEWHVYDDDPGDDLRLPAAEVFIDNGNIGLHLYKQWSDCSGEPPPTGLTMPQARAFALRLLDAPTATAQDVERMIGELS